MSLTHEFQEDFSSRRAMENLLSIGGGKGTRHKASAMVREAQPDVLAAGNLGVTVSLSRNKTLFEEGDKADYSYRVISGAVRLCKLLPDGRRQISDFCLPGDTFGFIAEENYTLTAEAVEDAVLVRYSRQTVGEACKSVPATSERVLAEVLRELSSAKNHLVMLGRQTARERIASFLLMVLDRQPADKYCDTRVYLPMGRQDIADYLGLTIETVSRAISELRRSGVVRALSTREILIRDLGALTDISSGCA